MPTNESEKLMRVRASLRGTLTRTKNYIDQHDYLQEEEIETRLQTIEKAFEKFQDTQEKIESGTDDETLEQEIEYRGTPGPNGKSPYELMFGRSIRTQLHAMLYKPTASIRRFSGALQIREFHLGERVQIRTYNHPHRRWKFGVVTQRIGHLHYKVKTMMVPRGYGTYTRCCLH
ncbi:hypothetical protein ACJJTC_019737 [Scirpophaga incertulas]